MMIGAGRSLITFAVGEGEGGQRGTSNTRGWGIKAIRNVFFQKLCLPLLFWIVCTPVAVAVGLDSKGKESM